MAALVASDKNEIREVCLVQIEHLEERLASCELKRDGLQKQNEDLLSHYNALQKDMKLATDFRKQLLAAKKKQVDELLHQRQEQATRLEEGTQALKLLPGPVQELQERIEELRSENRMQEAKSEELKECVTQQLSKLELLEKQLRISEKEEREAGHNMKKTAEYERQMLIDEIEQDIENMTAEELQLERSQLDKFMKQNEVVRSRNVSLQEKINVLEDRVTSLSSEVQDMKEDVAKRTQKVERAKMNQQKLQVEAKDCLTNYKLKWTNDVNLRRSLAAVTEQYRQIPDQCDLLPEIIGREMDRSTALEGIMQEAVIILRHILAHSENTTDTGLETTRLLEILQTTSHWRPVTTTSMEKSSEGEKQRRPQTRKVENIQFSQHIDGETSPSAMAEPKPVNSKKAQRFLSHRRIPK